MRIRPSIASRAAARALLLLLLCSIGATVFLLNQDAARLVNDLQGAVHRTPQAAWWLFALLAGISQLLIVPSGSLLLMAGGFLLGALPAAMIYAVVQIVTTWPVLWVGHRGGLAGIEQRLGPVNPTLANAADALKAAPFSLSLVLRLTPIVPSAVACLLSVAFAIPRASFLLATTLVCWVRPLFFASVGAAVPRLGHLSDPAAVLNGTNLWPLLLVFTGAALLLASRLWVNYRVNRALAKP